MHVLGLGHSGHTDTSPSAHLADTSCRISLSSRKGGSRKRTATFKWLECDLDVTFKRLVGQRKPQGLEQHLT